MTRTSDAVYANLTKSPLPVAVPLPDGRSDTVWLDGDRLVAGIRERLGTSTGLGRVPLLLHELRAGDRSRAAREIVGNDPAPGRLANRALRELVNCYDDYGRTSVKTLKDVNARARPPFRRVVNRDCKEWLPRLADASTRTPVRSDIPTLILTGYFDDRTPTEHARRIASTLSRAYLVEFPDEGHDARPSRCHCGDCAAILGGSDATARHVVRRDDPAYRLRDDMGAGESTMSRESLSHRRISMAAPAADLGVFGGPWACESDG